MTCQAPGCASPAEVRRARIRLLVTAEERTGMTTREATYVAQQCEEHWAVTLGELGREVEA